MSSCSSSPNNPSPTVTLLFTGHPASASLVGYDSTSRAGATSGRVQLGEGTLWDHITQTLYWIDILGQTLYSHHPQTAETKQWPLPYKPGTVFLSDNPGVVLVATQGGMMWVDTQTGEIRFSGLHPEENALEKDLRYNDGKTDPHGRIVVGTMCLDESENGMYKGSLFSIDDNGHSVTLLTRLSIPNGLCWNSAGDRFYHIDTPSRCMREFPYDCSNGQLDESKQRVAIRFPVSWGHPDGCAIDCNDHIWVSSWSGGCVSCFDPATGECLRSISLPHVTRVSNCAFGGADLTDLFVTTAAPDPNFDYKAEPLAGSLFVIHNLGVKGRQAVPYKGKMNIPKMQAN